MTKRLLLLATALSFVLVPAMAQQQPQKPPAQTQPAQGQPAPPSDQAQAAPDDQQQDLAPTDETGRRLPILTVTSVEVLRSSHSSRLDIVRAVGYVSSSGWTSPTLVPLTVGAPSDGMLDLVFDAGAPPASTAADGFEQVEAILPIDQGHPFKGVRVRSATNVVALKSIPGFVEIPAPTDPCANCVGKVFVAKGATPPAGVPASELVREQDLPPSTHIIKPTDGITEMPFDPNHLTLVIGDDGKIADAAWD